MCSNLTIKVNVANSTICKLCKTIPLKITMQQKGIFTTIMHKYLFGKARGAWRRDNDGEKVTHNTRGRIVMCKGVKGEE